MLKAKVFKIFGTVLCLMIAGAALGAIYTWTGDSYECQTNDNCVWQERDNWYTSAGFPPYYPHSTIDDAQIGDAVTIKLLDDEAIDDLYLSDAGQQTFTTNDQAWTVTCDTITISNASVKLTNEAGFEAVGTEPCPKK